jgi:hypothetical protein
MSRSGRPTQLDACAGGERRGSLGTSGPPRTGRCGTMAALFGIGTADEAVATTGFSALRDNTVTTNVLPDPSKSSRAADKHPMPERFGHHDHSVGQVEGLVLRKRGGSSSLPGRTKKALLSRGFRVVRARSVVAVGNVGTRS